MATFTGTSGTDNFIGSSAADDFYFGVADLNPTDTINGGGTLPGDGVDRLFVTSGGAINLAQMNAIRNIEEIRLSNNGNALFVFHELFGNLTNGFLSILGSDSGADTIEAVLTNVAPGYTAVQSANDLFVDAAGGSDFIVAGPGDDTILGGDGNDNIVAFQNLQDPNVISGVDVIHGNAGNDSIRTGNGLIYGDEGDDHFYFDGEKNPTATVNGGDGYDVVHGSGFANVEFVNVEALKLGGAYTPEELMFFSDYSPSARAMRRC
jgi:hypothetical protein